MFATHYHELTELSDTYPSIHNLSVKVSEDRNDIVFLHNIAEGPASKSYGIHVAKLAGVPKGIRTAASKKLKQLENSSVSLYGGLQKQMSFFETDLLYENEDDSSLKELAERISEIDINNMTPIEALNLLGSLAREARESLGEQS